MGAFTDFQRKRLSEISFDDIQALVNDRIGESLFLDYKQDYDRANDKGKEWIAEALKDITGLANAQGGDLIIGIAEDNHCASKIIPLHDGDSFYRTIIDIATTLIQPRINGLDARPIKTDDGYVVVIRVPQSNKRPHIALWKNTQLIAGKRLNERRTISLNGDEIHSMVMESKAKEKVIPIKIARLKKWVDLNYENSNLWKNKPSHNLWCFIVPHNSTSNYWRSGKGAIQKERGMSFLEDARELLLKRIHQKKYFMTDINWNWSSKYCRPDRYGFLMPMREDYGYSIRVDDTGAVAMNQLIYEQSDRFRVESFLMIILLILDYYIHLHTLCRLQDPLVDMIAGIYISDSYNQTVMFNEQEHKTPISFQDSSSGLLPEDRNQLPYTLFDNLYYTFGFSEVDGYIKDVLLEYVKQKV